MDHYEIQRCTRRCAASGRELAEGEAFFSVLISEGAQVQRYDYAAAAWTGPPEKAIGWWKSQMPSRDAKKSHLAPSEALLEFFVGLADQPEQQDLRYVLALLLVRRRILRLEETGQDPDGSEVLALYCPRDESQHRVHVALPDESRAAQIEAELDRLLFAKAS
jgi:hypothetical protein